MGIFEFLEKRRTQTGEGQSALAGRARVPLRTFHRWLAQGDMPLKHVSDIVAASRRAPVKHTGAPRNSPLRSITVEELVQDLDRVRRERARAA